MDRPVKQPLKIGIIGDYNPMFRVHLTTDAALSHSAAALEIPIDVAWLPTPSFDQPSGTLKLQDFDGLWCSAGSPYVSMAGALNAIRYAREKDRPFIAT